MCGVNMKMVESHSTRSASTRAAKFALSETIIKTTGLVNDCMFRKFYNQAVMQGNSVKTFP